MDAVGLFTRRVPHAGLGRVQPDPGVLPESGGQGVVQCADSRWACDDVDIVEVSEHGLAVCEFWLDRCQGGVLCQAEQSWHERVALFLPFCLQDAMRLAPVISPYVCAGCPVPLVRIGVQRRQLGVALQSGQHCAPGHVIVCPDGV